MSMQQVVIATPDGEVPAELFTPDGQAPENTWPGVVFLTDIWGVRPASERMARRVADQGYAVLLPHLLYRTEPMQYDPFLSGGERNRDIVQKLLGGMNAGFMARDGVAYVNFLLDRPEVAGTKVAVVGYCFSGAMAVRTAAAVPDKVAAAASFHGGHLVTDKPDSPHRLLPQIKAGLYFGHAVQDQSATPEQIAVLDHALKDWGGRFESEFYEGALHGWTVEGRPDLYNPAQSERHFEKLFALLKRNLK